ALNHFAADQAEPPAAEPPAAEPPVIGAPAPTAPAATGDGADDEMLEVFLEEAREVIGDARQAQAQLAEAPDDVALLTTLRRAFHTLKGSSRMVGLASFGEA